MSSVAVPTRTARSKFNDTSDGEGERGSEKEREGDGRGGKELHGVNVFDTLYDKRETDDKLRFPDICAIADRARCLNSRARVSEYRWDALARTLPCLLSFAGRNLPVMTEDGLLPNLMNNLRFHDLAARMAAIFRRANVISETSYNVTSYCRRRATR